MIGWFAIKRGTLDHDMFAPVKPWSRFEAWVWMVENAAYKPVTIDIGGKPYRVERGSLCFAQRFLASKFGWSKKKVSTFLENLESHGAIKIGVAKTGTGTRSKRTQVTLCNYDKYQSSGTKTDPKRDQKGTKEEQVTNNNTSANADEAKASQPVEVSILSKAVWDAGKPFLASRGVSNPGAVIGKWLKDHSPAAILSALEIAQKAGTQDPIPYINECLKGFTDDNRTHQSFGASRGGPGSGTAHAFAAVAARMSQGQS